MKTTYRHSCFAPVCAAILMMTAAGCKKSTDTAAPPVNAVYTYLNGNITFTSTAVYHYDLSRQSIYNYLLQRNDSFDQKINCLEYGTGALNTEMGCYLQLTCVDSPELFAGPILNKHYTIPQITCGNILFANPVSQTERWYRMDTGSIVFTSTTSTSLKARLTGSFVSMYDVRYNPDPASHEVMGSVDIDLSN